MSDYTSIQSLHNMVHVKMNHNDCFQTYEIWNIVSWYSLHKNHDHTTENAYVM